MTPDGLRGRVQPDQRSCGPSSLVAARMLLDETYAEAHRGPEAFARAVLDLHRQVTAPVAFGATQLPWPRALGTPPWAVARAISRWSGRRYRTHLIRWGEPHRVVARLAEQELPCPLYVGDAWLPRHVVLVCGDRLYDPARGAVSALSLDELRAGDLAVTGRWRRPWFAVLPSG